MAECFGVVGRCARLVGWGFVPIDEREEEERGEIREGREERGERREGSKEKRGEGR